MTRVVVSEFSLRRLDRTARLAGEVFGFDDLAEREARAASSPVNGLHLWLAAAVLGLAGLGYLVA